MISVDIPGWGKLRLRYCVLDLNGTLALEGKVSEEVGWGSSPGDWSCSCCPQIRSALQRCWDRRVLQSRPSGRRTS